MPHRRILSLWFPRMGAERVLRTLDSAFDHPVAVIATNGNAQMVTSLSASASAHGLSVGQPVRDARAVCPALRTFTQNPMDEQIFLRTLRRWAGKFSPWVAEQGVSSLVVDLTGCAHLFGGEEQLLAQIETECADLGLTIHAGIADTVGAAWALARYANQPLPMARTGDAIDQEAYATRSRAVKRRNWERGGPAPALRPPGRAQNRIAAPGKTQTALAALPVAALRLENDTLTDLNRLGLRTVQDLAGQARAGLARRFGKDLVRRLDQALGIEPEPVSPAQSTPHFAVRMTVPDPIGLESDIIAAIDRLLPRLCETLTVKGHAARAVRAQFFRADQTMDWFDIGLAKPSANPDRIRPLLLLKTKDIDAGFGIDCVRLEAVKTEPCKPRHHSGHMEAARDATARLSNNSGLDDLIGRIGARVGLEAVTRLHPADSHIPEKVSKTLAAAWSEPELDWPSAPFPRPAVLWRPELVTAEDRPRVPLEFRWRRRPFQTKTAVGPERIAPEWWLDEPDWRTGVRDYWRVTTVSGDRLWLYYAHGAGLSAGWFCHGAFA